MMKKIFLSLVILFAFSCTPNVSIADADLDIEEGIKIETIPQPYSESDLYGYWIDVNNTQEIKILKMMSLAPNGTAVDSLRIQVVDNVEEIKQDSTWKFDVKSSILMQKITKITYKINGKIEPKNFGDIEPVKVSVIIQKRGKDIFMGLARDDGTLEIYQKITAEMRDEIHKKAQKNNQK